MDLIDRQDAIKALRDTFLGDTYELDVVACGAIQTLPTVDAEPVRHGYITLKTIYGRDRVNCSVCGYEYTRMDGDIHNYCPNCGAKMNVEQEKKNESK